MLTYNLATRVRLSNVFTDKSTTPEVPADPTTVTLYVKSPAGVVTEYAYPADLIRTGVGLYQFDFTPDATGTWRYKWQGQGDLEVTSVDILFRVAESEVVNPWP